MSKDRFEKLERNPVGQELDLSGAGAFSRRFRRWLEFKGEKPVKLELEPVKPKPGPVESPTPGGVHHQPPASTPANGSYGRIDTLAKRAARATREAELRTARERAQRARNRLLWVLAGFGGIGFLVYLLAKGGISGAFAELIFMAIVAIVVTIAQGNRDR